MSKPRDWYVPADVLIPNYAGPAGEPPLIHVIEAAPVLAEIAQLKKQLAETKKQLDDLIAAELGG